MKRTIVLLLSLAPLPLTTVRATTPDTPAAEALATPFSAPLASGEEYYFASLKTIRPGDLTSLEAIDFGQFRRSYFEATKGSRLPSLDSNIETKLGEAFAQRRWDEVIAVSDTILGANFTRIRAHTLKAYALHQKGQDAHFHFTVAQRLIESILATGDGKSFETAFHVLFVDEEYDILKHLQLQFTGQALMGHEGHHYDVLMTEDSAGAASQLYFDITEHMQRLKSLLK
jgi:hypothetical protein